MRILFTSTAGLATCTRSCRWRGRPAMLGVSSPIRKLATPPSANSNARAPCTSRTVSARKGTVTQLRDTPPSGTGPLSRLLCACLCR